MDLTKAVFHSVVLESELLSEDKKKEEKKRLKTPNCNHSCLLAHMSPRPSMSFFNMVNFSLELCVVLCVGGFQRAATKAGSARCLCTRWMPGKMPTPICSPKKRPATCTRYNVGTCIIYSLANKGFPAEGLRGHVLGTILADA